MTITIEQLNSKVTQLSKKYEQGKGQLALLRSQRKEKKKLLDQTTINLNDWKLVQILYDETTRFAREQQKQRMEATVTAALQSIIHDKDLKFKVIMSKRGDDTTANWAVSKLYNGEWVNEDVEDGKGGGVENIVSSALQLASVELSRPKSEGAFIIDEPGRDISVKNNYSELFAEFLAEYSKETGRQIILVTHKDEQVNVAEKQYYVDMDEDENSVVSEVSGG